MPGLNDRADAGNAAPIVSRRRVGYSPADLEQAVRQLRASGFIVTADPFLLAHGVLLAAWNPDKEEGYLIAAEDVGPVARVGLAVLDPHADGDDRPRWQRPGTPDGSRTRRYAEAVLARCCAEVQSTPEGARNQALNRAAFVLGQFLGWGLSEADVLEDLTAAAMSGGLSGAEARQTAHHALRRGAEHPRDLTVLEPRPPGQASNDLDGWRPRR